VNAVMDLGVLELRMLVWLMSNSSWRVLLHCYAFMKSSNKKFSLKIYK
jgi:hypothetical protein